MPTSHRWVPVAFMVVAPGCTLTAEDYSPSSPDGELVGADAVTNTMGAQPATGTNADAPDATGTGVRTEGLAPDMIAGNEGAGSGGSSSAQPDAGAPVDAAPPVAALPELVGWAGVAGLGVETTTGGGATEAVLVQTAQQLRELAARPEPLTLAIAGTLDVGRLDLASNKTLFGTNPSATLRGGIAIRGTPQGFARNVIVHNLAIDAATSTLQGDGIEIRYAHHVWIDHCELRDAADGLIDVVRGSDFVTVSRTRFRYTAAAADPAHRFAVLVGHDVANGAEDQGRLNVTWHHNWWSEGVDRAVLGRFGWLHFFNNLFSSSDNTNVLEADVSSQLRVENNVFAGVTAPHAIVPTTSGTLAATGNVYVEALGPRDVAGTVFVPPYAYELEPALAPIVTGDVGPQ